MSVEELQTVERDSYRFGKGPDITLQPGTLGWSIDDLRDPVVRSLWEQGRYEIIEGVLTIIPPRFFRGGSVVDNLKFILYRHFHALNVRSLFSSDVNIVVTSRRIVCPDGVAICGKDLRKFDSLKFEPPFTDWQDHELTIPPTIVIESVSKGHEAHDRVTKRKWYAEFKVPNYWIIDGFARTLECLRLEGDHFIVDVAGKQNDILTPSSFPGLSIPLKEVWEQ